MHAWPCNPHYQERTRLGEAPWTDLTRCRGCGSLWEAMDRGWRRVTVAQARATFAVEVAPFERPDLGGPQSILGVYLSLNDEQLHRIIVVTDAGHWQVGERGALMWIFWKDLDRLELSTAEHAIELAREHWGEPAAAALRLGLETGFDPRQFGALDLAHAFDREVWDRAWQPRTVAIVEAMFAAGTDPQTRVDAALGFARRAGYVGEEDIRAAGFAIPPNGDPLPHAALDD
jgi:hypothetical protein